MQSSVARLSHHGSAMEVTLQEAGMKGGEQGRDRDRDRLHCSGWIPSCTAVQGAAGSRSGNKDMISSGVNFLGALKNGAGKIWSTVIMEEDKDKKVSGRAPGMGTPEHPRKSSRASPAPSQIILDAWAMNIADKKSGEDKHSLLLIREQRWGKVTAWRRKGILFPWQLKFETSIWKSLSPPRVRSGRATAQALELQGAEPVQSPGEPRWARLSGTTVSPPGESASHEAAPAGEGETSQTASKPSSQGPQAPPRLLKLSHFHGVNNRDRVTASTSPIISWHSTSLLHHPQVPCEPSTGKEQGIMAQNMFWQLKRSVQSKLEKKICLRNRTW